MRGGRGARAAGRGPRWTTSSPTWAASGGDSPATASCAGSGRRRASIHLATAAIVNAVWDLWAKVEGKPLWKLLADMTPEQLVALRRLPLPHRRAHARRGAAISLRAARAGRRARGRAAARRLSRVHHVGRLARLLRRQDPPACAARRVADGWTHFKIKVGARPGRRRPPLRDHARGDRARPRADGRRQPGAGTSTRRSRAMRRAGRFDPVVDRGADQPRRRAGPRRDRARRSAPIGVATGEHVQNRVIFKQLLQAEAIDFCQIDALPARRRQRGAGGAAAGGEVRRAGVPARGRRRPVRVRAAPVDRSTTSRSAASLDGPHDRVRRPPARALRRPGRQSRDGRYWRRPRRATASRCTPASLAEFGFPDGDAWRT